MAARIGLTPLVAGAVAGAYGMNQASNSNWGNLWGILPKSPWDSTGSTSGGGGTDISSLRGEVSRLTSMMSDLVRSGQQGRPTVVHLGGRNGWTVLVYPAIAGGAVLYLYCKATGTGVMDLLFVSRNSLAAFRNSMQEGLSNVWGEMRKQKEEFVKMVSTLGHKQDTLQGNQDQLMAKQAEMDSLLHRVDDNVDNLDSKADQLDGRLQDVHVGVQAANQGIYMLMSVVSEVTSKIGLHNSRASQSLQRYLQGGPAWGSNSIANTPANTSCSSINAAAVPSSSSHSRTPSDYPLPLPALSDFSSGEVKEGDSRGGSISQSRCGSGRFGLSMVTDLANSGARGQGDMVFAAGGDSGRLRGFNSFSSSKRFVDSSSFSAGQQQQEEGEGAITGSEAQTGKRVPAQSIP